MKYLMILGMFIFSGCTSVNIPDIVWESELTEGALLYGSVPKDTQIFIQNEDKNNATMGLGEIPTHQGRFIVGVPQDAKKLTLKIKKDGQMQDISFPIPKRKWQEDYVNGLPPKKVNPPESEKKRITDEALAMRQKRQQSDFQNFPQNWHLPLAKYKRISSPFGSRRILNGQVTQGHSGTDYAADMGTPVLAANDGRIVLTHPDMFYTGATILIDHGYGVYTSYSHLSQIDVKQGQIVKSGTKIGEVGMSGRATGPHLHFGLSWYGVRLNPEDLY